MNIVGIRPDMYIVVLICASMNLNEAIRLAYLYVKNIQLEHVSFKPAFIKTPPLRPTPTQKYVVS